MSLYDSCSRCLGRVRQRGDHLCPPCAELLGRDVGDPFWGDFANHPDAKLTPEGLRARDFVGVIGGLLRGKAA